MLKIFHTDMRMWRNGRRACLRGKFERVGVRPSPSAPAKKTDIVQSFLFFYFSAPISLHIAYKHKIDKKTANCRFYFNYSYCCCSTTAPITTLYSPF